MLFIFGLQINKQQQQQQRRARVRGRTRLALGQCHVPGGRAESVVERLWESPFLTGTFSAAASIASTAAAAIEAADGVTHLPCRAVCLTHVTVCDADRPADLRPLGPKCIGKSRSELLKTQKFPACRRLSEGRVRSADT